MKLALINAPADSATENHSYEWLGGHQVVKVYGHAPAGLAGAVAVVPLQQWEALLHETEVDAVVVMSAAGIVDGLPKIVQSGLPLIALHPIAGMLECFTLQMTQRESGAMIFPLVFEHDDAAVATLREWFEHPESSPIGEVQQASVERPLGLRTRKAVERAFAIDAFLLRRVVGSIAKINAVGADPLAKTEHDSWARLRVSMVARRGEALSWSTTGSQSPSAVTGNAPAMMLQGEAGTARISMATYPLGWEITVDGADETISLPQPTSPLDRVEGSLCDGHNLAGHWDDACRALELADTIEYSLRRGKTVELYETEVSEAGTFRGVMAASGCLILLGTLAFTLVLAAIESIWSLGGPLRYVPWAILAIGLTVFLALQLFSLAVPQDDSQSPRLPTDGGGV